jgi:hypothetical protein
LDDYQWPICLCDGPCQCSLPLVPSWILRFGKPHPLNSQRCLSTGQIPFNSDGFCEGIHLARNKLLDGIPVSFSETILRFVDYDQCARHRLGSSRWKEDEAFLKKLWKKAPLTLERKCSGFLCGWVLFDQNQHWQRLFRYAETDKCSALYSKQLSQLFHDLHAVLIQLEGLKVWFGNHEQERQFPLTTNVLKAATFWLSQKALYLIHDWKLIHSKGWPFALTHFIAGVLPWQVGWFESNEEVVSNVAKIMLSD